MLVSTIINLAFVISLVMFMVTLRVRNELIRKSRILDQQITEQRIASFIAKQARLK